MKRSASKVRSTLLGIVADQGPLYGLEVALEYQRRTGSPRAFTAGDLYPNLRRLELLGWVDVETKEPAGSPQHPVSHYTITEAGRRALFDEGAETTSVLKRVSKLFRHFKGQ